MASGIVAIADIDTRALTRRLRSAGVMRGGIANWRRPRGVGAGRTGDSIPKMEGSDLVSGVTAASVFDWPQKSQENSSWLRPAVLRAG